MVDVINFSSWHEFKRSLQLYTDLSSSRRRQLIFRGQANAAWRLESTLDRRKKFASDDEREECVKKLIQEFKRGSYGLESSGISMQVRDDLEWQLLGRHHGLPMPILDWTESPYIAAFFAFDECLGKAEDTVSVWMLDRAQIDADDDFPIQFLDDDAYIQFNLRAIEQRGLFLRVKSALRSFEDLFAEGTLTRFDIPGSDAIIALEDLDEMAINRRKLFRNLDGAAVTATRRVLEI